MSINWQKVRVSLARGLKDVFNETDAQTEMLEQARIQNSMYLSDTEPKNEVSILNIDDLEVIWRSKRKGE